MIKLINVGRSYSLMERIRLCQKAYNYLYMIQNRDLLLRYLTEAEVALVINRAKIDLKTLQVEHNRLYPGKDLFLNARRR